MSEEDENNYRSALAEYDIDWRAVIMAGLSQRQLQRLLAGEITVQEFWDQEPDNTPYYQTESGKQALRRMRPWWVNIWRRLTGKSD
ncbi:MAG: hypothetical protein ACLFTK_16750 [Anaerolineales bacterium]